MKKTKSKYKYGGVVIYKNKPEIKFAMENIEELAEFIMDVTSDKKITRWTVFEMKDCKKLGFGEPPKRRRRSITKADLERSC